MPGLAMYRQKTNFTGMVNIVKQHINFLASNLDLLNH